MPGMAPDETPHADPDQEVFDAQILQDCPELARLLADAGLRQKYSQFLSLAHEIHFDAIMREIGDIFIANLTPQENHIIARALSYEERAGWNKARKAIHSFLEISRVRELAPVTGDYGAEDLLKRAGY